LEKRIRLSSELFTRKSYTGFPLLPKVVTLNDLERRKWPLSYGSGGGGNYVKMVEDRALYVDRNVVKGM